MTLQEELDECRRRRVLLLEAAENEMNRVARKWTKKMQRVAEMERNLIAQLQAEEDQQKK